MEATAARRGSPPEQLRAQLEEMKLRGLGFDYAWKLALSRIRWPLERRSRHEWRTVIDAQREVWESCYLDVGDPVDFGGLLPALLDDDDWEPANAHLAA